MTWTWSLYRGSFTSWSLKFTLNPHSLLNFSSDMNVFTLSISHTVGPISIVVGSIRPDKSTPSFSFVVNILSFMDVTTIKDCPAKALNTLGLVNLTLEIIRISRSSKGKVRSLQNLLEVGLAQINRSKLFPSLFDNISDTFRWRLEHLCNLFLSSRRVASLSPSKIIRLSRTSISFVSWAKWRTSFLRLLT